MPHKVFKNVYKEKELYRAFDTRQYSFVYFDFIEEDDIYKLLIKDKTFN